MAGETIDILSRRTFDMTDMGTNKVQTFVIIQALDVSAYTQGLLMLRAHTKDMPSGSTIDLLVYTTAPTDEDPSKDFVYGTAVATATITAAATAPTLAIGALSANFGGSLRVVLKASTAGTSATFTADLSAAISLKE